MPSSKCSSAASLRAAESSHDTINQASEHRSHSWTPLLSVIIPVYNEVETIYELLRRVARTPFPKEIFVVDDNSTDGTRELLRDLPDMTRLLDGSPLPAPCRVKALFHPTNQGKGQAVQTALRHVSGSFVLIQDADLEYSPSDYPQILAPLLAGQADVVYGSRFLDSPTCSFSWHTATNKVLTTLSNICTRLQLTDMETCYKAFRAEVLQGLTLRSKRFGFEPEITARIARGGVRICEVPISYSPRSYAEGKKIRWQDGFVALWTILRCHILEADERVEM
ncbi:MAG: glycosyltransferase family 2 protein [Desulfurellaceae bacterium]|nr:glycosyltransferase family 2 protein [Desulfurellaceae bacterium]